MISDSPGRGRGPELGNSKEEEEGGRTSKLLMCTGGW